VINAGVGVGGYIAPRLTPVLIRRYGESEAFLYLAAFLAIPFAITLLLARGPGGNGSSAHQRADLNTASDVVKLPLFWMFGISLFFAAHTLTGVQEHLVLYLRREGLSLPSAGLALSLLLGASAFGKLLGGAAADHYSSRVSLLLSIVCLMLGIGGLLTINPHSTLVYAAAAMFGLGFGGVFNAPSIIAFEHFGTRRVGTILGLFMMFFGLGTSTGGLLSGAIYDQTHQYTASFLVDLLSAAIAFVLLFVLKFVGSGAPAPLAATLEKKIA
jgi:MFS family permease